MEKKEQEYLTRIYNKIKRENAVEEIFKKESLPVENFLNDNKISFKPAQHYELGYDFDLNDLDRLGIIEKYRELMEAKHSRIIPQIELLNALES